MCDFRIWKSFSRWVIKQPSKSLGFRYTICDDNDDVAIVLYQDDMLAMCKAVIRDAEKESEDA